MEEIKTDLLNPSIIAISYGIFDQTSWEKINHQIMHGVPPHEQDLSTAGIIILARDAAEQMFAPYAYNSENFIAHMEYILDHEKAHLANADEPVSDIIATLKNLQKYKAPTLIEAWKDMRLVKSGDESMPPEYHDEYGYKMENVSRHVLSLSPEFIASVTQEDILNVRMQKFGPHEDIHSLRFNFKPEYKEKDWPRIARIARDLTRRTQLNKQDELTEVAANFAAAAFRLSNPEAYHNPKMVEKFFGHHYRHGFEALNNKPRSLIYDKNTIGQTKSEPRRANRNRPNIFLAR